MKGHIITISIACTTLMLAANSCELAQWAVTSDPSASNKTKGTVVGATSGAQLGAWVGGMTGSWDKYNQNTLLGAAIGAVAGAAAGNVVGSGMDKKQGVVHGGSTVAPGDERGLGENDYRYANGYSCSRDNLLYFKGGKTKLTSAAKRQLDQVAARLRNDRAIGAEIYGHTDDSGSYSERRRVSVERANQVANYLRRRGVALDQIYARGCADQYPIASNRTKEGRKRNNRVEILITRGTPSPTGNTWQY